MARRKRQFLDDEDDSDSYDGSEDGGDDFNLNNDPDAREERELFENPYKRGKRRKTGGKEDATYGVFAEDSEDEGFGGRSKKPVKRTDWTKCVEASYGFHCEYSFALSRAPSFVSGDNSTVKETTGEAEDVDDVESPDDGEEDEDEDEEDSAEEDSSASPSFKPSKSPSPRASMDDDDAESRPRFGGIGAKRMDVDSDNAFTSTSSGIGFQKGGIGIGFQKGGNTFATSFDKGSSGIGMSRGGFAASTSLSDDVPPSAPVEDSGKEKSTTPIPEDAPELPSSFSTSRQQRSFVREKEVPKRTATPLSAQERMHFNKLQGSFGARMLSKMGWEAGTGLGTERTGIVTPIESKLRPKNMGIAYKGFGEKTDQSKAEARRRGEKVSDDEDEKKPSRGKGKGKDVKRAREDAWKRPKKSKLKVEHKTYEEILAEAGSEPAPSGVGIIIDATGATVSEVCYLFQSFSLTYSSPDA